MYTPDPIVAIATPPGQGGVGVVRLSGQGIWPIADAAFRGSQRPSEAPGGTFLYGRVVDRDGGEIDTCLCLVFRAPRSYSGEDTVELQGHGGPVVLRKILRRCLELGARMADPGEFTRRAFLNGRMDLLQAEAVADLIHAQSDRAAAAAIEQLDGTLSRRFNRLYDLLVAAAADVETSLDFVEEDLPDSVFAGIGAKLRQGQEELQNLLATWDEGRLLREGARAVLMGRPNAGKSTLFNALLGQDRAIVTDLPGTTRDVIEETVIVAGIPVRLLDTAGLRETVCRIEQEGIRRARAHSESADIAVYLIDASQPFCKEDADYLQRLDPARTVVVLNKIDQRNPAFKWTLAGRVPLEVSLLDGQGVSRIRQSLAERLEGAPGLNAPAHAVISERHRRLLEQAGHELDLAEERMAGEGEIGAAPAAEHLRCTLELLGQVTGRVYHQELLDSVFSRFCVGK